MLGIGPILKNLEEEVGFGSEKTGKTIPTGRDFASSDGTHKTETG